MRRFLSWPAVALLAAALFLARCSSDLAGGTETENPEVSACAALVFTAFDDSLAWNPRGYVPGGLHRLDSAGICSGPVYRYAGGSLAKQWVESTDTVVGTMRIITYTIFIDDTVLIADTTLVPDTMIIDSTIVDVDTLHDTSHVVTQGDTTHIVQTRYETTEYVVSDTVPFFDTLYRTDTLFLFDSLFFVDTVPADTSSPPDSATPSVIDSQIDYTYAAGASSPSRSVSSVELYLDAASDSLSLVVTTSTQEHLYLTPSNVRVTNEASTSVITKDMVSATGAVIRELFKDKDGDGSLFGAGYQAIAMEHEYRLTGDSVWAAVEFNGGRDNSFATTANNEVLALWRHTITATRNETVSYNRADASMPGDTMRLSALELLQDSSLGIYSRSYLLRRGRDLFSGNEDTLVSWSATAEYQEGDIRRIQVHVAPDEPLSHGARPTTGTLSATIWLRNGSVGVLDSVSVDFDLGTVTGTYYKDGVSQEIVFTRWGCCM
jgi:hypothetical protein